MNANKYANAAQQPSLEQLLRAEITALREQVAELKAMVVMRCDLDTPPQFSQGFQPHEVLEPVTAEHCQWFVAKIEKLTKERDELKTVPMKYRRMQFNAELQDEVTQLQKQLAALAEQNKKLRKAIVLACAAIDEGVIDHEWNFGIIREAKYLPDLASPVLNSIPKEPTLPVFDADSPRFRQVFDEAVQAHNLPGKRKGEGYRSPITQWCFEIAYSVVNRLRLYEK